MKRPAERRQQGARVQPLADAVAVALAAVLALSQGAAAQTRIQSADPVHEITRDETTGVCSVVLIPSRVAGAAPPRLTLTTAGRADPGRFGVEAGAAPDSVETMLVFSNRRAPFEPVPPRPASVVMESRIWQAIEGSDKRGIPLFVTSKSAAGSYSSARYDDISPAAILAILRAQCGLSPDSRPAPTAGQLRQQESRLNLSGDQLRHIRWVLSDRIADSDRAPPPAPTLTAVDRARLQRYAAAVGEPASPYLTRKLAELLAGEAFIARTPDHDAMADHFASGDWQTYRNEAGQCVVSSPARDWRGLAFYTRPEMQFRARPGIPGKAMVFDLVTPNPFRAGTAISVVVDAARYPLRQQDGRVQPAASGDGDAGRVMKALRRGRDIEFRGLSAASGTPIRVAFSGRGLNPVFRRMMDDCDRPGLKAWFR